MEELGDAGGIGVDGSAEEVGGRQRGGQTVDIFPRRRRLSVGAIAGHRRDLVLVSRGLGRLAGLKKCRRDEADWAVLEVPEGQQQDQKGRGGKTEDDDGPPGPRSHGEEHSDGEVAGSGCFSDGMENCRVGFEKDNDFFRCPMAGVLRNARTRHSIGTGPYLCTYLILG